MENISKQECCSVGKNEEKTNDPCCDPKVGKDEPCCF